MAVTVPSLTPSGLRLSSQQTFTIIVLCHYTTIESSSNVWMELAPIALARLVFPFFALIPAFFSKKTTNQVRSVKPSVEKNVLVPKFLFTFCFFRASE
jgi:hypothetical protein